VLHHPSRRVSRVTRGGVGCLGCRVVVPLDALLIMGELLGAVLVHEAGLDLLLEVRGRLGVHPGREGIVRVAVVVGLSWGRPIGEVGRRERGWLVKCRPSGGLA